MKASIFIRVPHRLQINGLSLFAAQTAAALGMNCVASAMRALWSSAAEALRKFLSVVDREKDEPAGGVFGPAPLEASRYVTLINFPGPRGTVTHLAVLAYDRRLLKAAAG